MNIPNSALRQILKNIPDRKQRDVIANIMTGKITHEVACLSEDVYEGKGKKKVLVREGCKGRVIAHIFNDGKIRLTISDGKAWLRASRHRLDGATGFQCWCGNDSRLCIQERGITGIEKNAITKSDIEQVYLNLQKKPANYPVFQGKQIIDGFAIQEIK